MIATIEGMVAEKLPHGVVVQLGGLGYEVALATTDWSEAAIGSTSKFYIYEHIREDSHQLFGFKNRADKDLFMLLLGVNGVGPKVAMQVMSAATGERLRAAIASGDSSLFKNVSGVGKKTAERIMVELKSKVSAEPGVELSAADTAGAHSDPAYQALVGLGYKPQQAAAAVATIPAEVTGEQERVRYALRNI